MTAQFAAPTADAIPLSMVSETDLDTWAASLSTAKQNWAKAQGFKGKIGQVVTFCDAAGRISGAAVGHGSKHTRKRSRFHLAAGAVKLPAGTYALETDLSETQRANEALGWLLASYRFDRYKTQPDLTATLVAPSGVDVARIEAIAQGEFLTRDLINTPTSDMGPDNLEQAVKDLAAQHGAQLTVIRGDELLKQNFPMIHTVGRASAQAPRLLDMRWGKTGPTLTLVGKGVCFDTGGLNLKPGASMGLMKKDMGGAAAVLGLAKMIMSTQTQLQLRVLIPAVENSVSSNAFRPGDVLTSRKGLTVEINNTDAEGRLVLADALAFADEESPDHILSMATLTGAARVAVGPDLAPYYSDTPAFVHALEAAASRVDDPVWRMPFHTPYEAMIEPAIADLDNAPKGGFAGSITAALFLRRFVDQTAYAHFDIYGWQPTAAPARPQGGVGQGTRGIFDALSEFLSA